MRRDRVDIVADMLEVISDSGRVLPTRLMSKSNISYPQLKHFLEELMGKELIKYEEERFIVMTDKGFQFLNQYKRAKEFEASFGLEL